MIGVEEYHVSVCALFSVQGGMLVHHTSLHWKQRMHRYMICCHTNHNNGILITLIRDFS
jgi:hypothetical protein